MFTILRAYVRISGTSNCLVPTHSHGHTLLDAKDLLQVLEPRLLLGRFRLRRSRLCERLLSADGRRFPTHFRDKRVLVLLCQSASGND